MSRRPADLRKPYRWQERPGRARFKPIDLNHDLDALIALLASERPAHVVNFAAQSMVGESWLYSDHWMMTDVSNVRPHELLRNYMMGWSASLVASINACRPGRPRTGRRRVHRRKWELA
jgi:UDP-glucose 4-epimerase